jgi:hypothetical protein
LESQTQPKRQFDIGNESTGIVNIKNRNVDILNGFICI